MRIGTGNTIGKKGPGGRDVEALAARYANVCNFNFASRLRIDPPTSADWNTPTDLSGNYNCIEVAGGAKPNFRDSVHGRAMVFTTAGTPTTAALSKDIAASDALFIFILGKFRDITSVQMVTRGQDAMGNGWSLTTSLTAASVPEISIVTTSGGDAQRTATGATAVSAGIPTALAFTFTPGTGLDVYNGGVLDGTSSFSQTGLRTSTRTLRVGIFNTDASGSLDADIYRLLIGTKVPDASVIKTLSTHLGGFNGVLAQNTDPTDGLILGDEFVHLGGGGYGWIPTVAIAGGG